MISDRLTGMARRWFIGEDAVFVFEPPIGTEPKPAIEKTNLYLHIPFCRTLCPYCPYDRIRYDKALTKPYLDAVLAEIDTYHDRFGNLEIGSIYIGGGTPTTLIDELGIMLDHIRKRFRVTGDIAVETIPSDISDDVIDKLKRYGVNLLSIGVQSFSDKYLKLIGRNYRSDILRPVIRKLNAAGFDSVNIDMMFALPGQTTEEVITDLETLLELEVDQVTLYPLFTFPYSTVGAQLDLKQVRFPRLPVRREMYRTIHNFFIDHGFTRVSVWGFKRENVPRYSSVTRDYYIGFGAGAGSYLPGRFAFNTFSVKAYVNHAMESGPPIALQMHLTPKVERYYWLYWRLYETYVPRKQLDELFVGDRRMKWLLAIAKWFGMYTEEEKDLVLTERGAFWIHLVQNYYVLHYIDKVWTVAMREAWPKRIPL
jgi:coproporphyrinogen III oxidase-like Fe-S oxidoreductase